MKVKFYGVRGSIPTPLLPDTYHDMVRSIVEHTVNSESSDIDSIIKSLPQELQTIYGGNTSCVYVTSGERSIILDCGSGLKLLGNHLSEEGVKDYHIIFSHLHHDHINGLPFFKPTFSSKNKIFFYGVHRDMEFVLHKNQERNVFPVQFNKTKSEKHFIHLNLWEKEDINGFKVQPIRMIHPNGSYGYRIEDIDGKTIIYATDCEYPKNRDFTKWINFYRDADLLIFDGQYTEKDFKHFYDYGHSTPIIGVEIAAKANVKKLMIYHHEPMYDSKMIQYHLHKAIEYRDNNFPNSNLEIGLANEGMEIDL